MHLQFRADGNLFIISGQVATTYNHPEVYACSTEELFALGEFYPRQMLPTTAGYQSVVAYLASKQTSIFPLNAWKSYLEVWGC